MAPREKHKVRHTSSLLILLIILITNPLSSQDLNHKSELVNKKIETSHFKSINVKGCLNLVLFDSDENFVIIETNKNDIKKIDITVDNDSCLNISSTHRYGESNRPKISVYFTELNEIKAKENVKVYCFTNFTTEYLNIVSDYDTEIQLFISSFKLNCNIEGFGKLNISGEIDTLYANIKNEVESTFLIYAKILNIEITDYSSLTIAGKTDYIHANVQKEGFLQALDLISHKACIDVKDYGEVQLYVTEKVEISAKEHSSVIIKGNPFDVAENKSEKAIVKK